MALPGDQHTHTNEPLMFRNVFVGVDGSQTGRDAIALARALADSDAQLTLAHVHGDELHSAWASTLASDRLARRDSRELLEAERDRCGVTAELVSVATPSVARGLDELVGRHGADLLVVGSCSRGRFGRVLAGDDTRASLNAAPCAVAIAPRGYATRPHRMGVVGVGYDFSPESRAALAAAHVIAARDGSVVAALAVVSTPIGASATPVPIDWREILEAAREAVEERLGALDGVEGHAVSGVASEELATFGDRVDLLIVGSRNLGPTRRLLLGSTSSALVKHGRCPLLILKRAALDTARDRPRGQGDRVGAA